MLRHESQPSIRRATLELTLASVFWGFGFVGARWALVSMGPLWLTGLRFTLAFLLTLPIMILMAKRSDLINMKENLRLAFIPGIFLALTIVFQTWGLLYTTATNSGFITTLYVLFVPMIEAIFFKKKLELAHFVLVAIALIGTALICNWSASAWNKGDFLTLLCALAGAGQIVWISRVATKIKSPFSFNNFQSFWCGLIGCILALVFEPFRFDNINEKAIIGFSSLLFGSTLIAFFIQVRAQKVLSSTTASLLCLLESPFAAIFAFWYLGERLGTTQWSGALLIIFSACYTIFLESRKNRTSAHII
ncbi:MAG: DMT family transporter [Pseudomonadota bacterium]|nr:DMT family transporter [Pseudomonadota bacterium]